MKGKKISLKDVDVISDEFLADYVFSNVVAILKYKTLDQAPFILWLADQTEGEPLTFKE